MPTFNEMVQNNDWDEAVRRFNRLTRERDEAEGALAKATDLLNQCKTGDCWCEVGVDNPMMKGRHTPKCNQIRLFISQCVEE